MSEEYHPNSIDATLSRIETQLNTVLAEHNRRLEENSSAIRKLWAALNRLDVRVAMIAGGVSVVAFLIELYFRH